MHRQAASIETILAHASLAKERAALMTAFEKAASEQGAAHAADGPSAEPPATGDADGVTRLPLDDAIKLLVRAVQEVEEVISVHLPYISLYLPMPLYISPYLPISPCVPRERPRC